MFDAWKEKRRKEKEAAWLAEIRARDADVGVPSSKTMSERMTKAAAKGMWDVVDDCLQKGADVKEELTVSRKWGRENYFPALSKIGGLGLYSERKMSLLCMAVIQNDVKAAKNLLAQGASPSSGYSGWDESYTPLSIAVYYNSAPMVQLLCDSGADLSWDKPLRIAEKKGYSDIIKIIRGAETQRAGGAPAQLPLPATAEEKIISDLEKLSPAAREKLLEAAREKFAPAAPAANGGLAQDVTVPKTINLKKPSA